MHRPGVELAISRSQVRHPNQSTTPPSQPNVTVDNAQTAMTRLNEQRSQQTCPGEDNNYTRLIIGIERLRVLRVRLTAVVVDRSTPRSFDVWWISHDITDDERRQKDALLDLRIMQDNLEHAVITSDAGRRRWRDAEGDVEVRWTGHQTVVSTQFLAERSVVERHRQVGGAVRHVTCPQ